MKSAFNRPELCNEEAAIAYVEAQLWPDGAICPHCGTIGEATKLKGKTTRPGSGNAAPAVSRSRCAWEPCSNPATCRCTSGFRRCT